MMILALELENVKSYEKAQIEFTPGVNSIVGHNGAGKSTIVEAIGFTLFNALGYNQSEFIRAGAKSASMTVAFLSASDERRYEVTRRIGTTSQIFVYDPELGSRICEGRADVDRFLYQHMGLEPGTDLTALFRDAVGVPQGTLTAAFLYTEANRRPIFDRLLQLEDYRTASDRLREPARLLRDRRGELETEIAGAAARLERLDGLLAEVTQDRARLQELETTKGQLQSRLARVTQEREGLESAQAAAAAAQQALAQAEQQVASLSQQVETAQGALTEAEAAQKTVAEHRAGFEAYNAAQAQQTQLDEQVQARRGLSEQLAQADKRAALHQAAVERAQADLVEIEQAEATVTALAEQVQTQTTLEEQIGQAQREAARLDDAQKQVAQYETALARMTEQRAQLQRAQSESARLEQARAEKESALETLRVEGESRREELARLKTQGESVKEQSAVLGREFALCPVCEKPLEDAQRQELLARNAQEIERLRKAYATAQKNIKSQEEQMTGLREALTGIENALRRAPRAEELARLEEEIANATRLREEALTTVEALRGAGDTIARLQAELARLGNPKQQHAVAAARAGQRREVEARLQAARTTLAQAEQEAAGLRDALEEFGDLDARLAHVRQELQMHLAAYQAVLSYRQLAEQVESRRAALAGLQDALATAQAQCEERRRAAEEAAARFDADAYARLREEEQELRTRLGVLENEARYIQERLARQEAEVAALQALAQELARLQARQATLATQEKALEKIRALLRQAQPHIARALVRRISESAGQIFGDIMQDYSRHLQWGEDYGVTLRVDEHERQFAQLSGGEQMSAALAVRLALLREMSNIEVAFFDEPTANLDETRRESLARQILQVRGFRQLFVISHDDTFEQATQNVIRVERINGSSRVYSA